MFAVPRLSASLPIPQRNCREAGSADATRHTHAWRGGGQVERSRGALASTPDHCPRQPPGVRSDEAPAWHVV